VVLKGDDSALDLAIKQLRKLINVVDVADFKTGQAVERELVLVKVSASAQSRSEIMQICDIFRAKIVNVAQSNVVIEITGDEGKITAFLGLIGPFGIIELARTGQLALTR
jgi:acetolactate synthase-1/3 small subunit